MKKIRVTFMFNAAKAARGPEGSGAGLSVSVPEGQTIELEAAALTDAVKKAKELLNKGELEQYGRWDPLRNILSGEFMLDFDEDQWKAIRDGTPPRQR